MTTYTYIAGRAKYAASSAQKTGGVTLGSSVVDPTYSNGTTTNTTAIAINVNSLLNKGTNALTGNALAKAMTTVLQFQSNVVGNKSASLKAGSDTYQYTAVKMFTTDSAVPTAPTVKVTWTVGATTADAYIGLSFLRTQDVTVTTGSSIGAGTHFDASFLTTGKLTFAGGSATVLMDVVGGQANDTITGGTGGDSLTGGLGDDVITGGDGADTVDGGTGTDTYIAGGSATAISVTLNTLTAATVTVTSGNGNDSIKNIENVTGTTGADTITGDSAANALKGAAGVDSLKGAGGADTFVFSDVDPDVDTTAGLVTDVVLDFASAVDTLDFTTAGSASNYTETLTPAANLAALLAAADTALTATIKYYFGVVGSDGYLVQDDDGTGYTSVIKLTGLTDMAYSDIV